MNRVVAFAVCVLLVCSLCVAQEDGKARIQELEKQMEAMGKQMEAMNKQLDDLKKKEITQQIEVLQKRVQGVEAARAPGVNTGYKKGFYIKTDDDQFAIRFNGRIHTDLRMYTGGPIEPDGGGDMHDTFMIRRAWFEAQGHVWGKQHVYKVQMDVVSDLELLDAYLELAYLPEAKVRFGQFKTPFGREWLVSTNYIQFNERSLANDLLAPNRDMGVMLHGNLFDGQLEYATAMVNGSSINTTNNDDSFDWVYRVVAHPFKKTKNPWLEGFEIGQDFMIGQQPAGPALRGRTAGDIDYFPNNRAFAGPTSLGIATQLPLPLTAAGQTRLPSYNTVGQMHGTRTRAGVDGAWYVGPFGLVGEYINVVEQRHALSQGVNQPTLTNWNRSGPHPYSLAPIEHGGWYVTASYLLTGEQKTAGQIVPKNNFDPKKGGWGAWEIAARIEGIEHQSADTILIYRYLDAFGNMREQEYKHLQDNAFTLGVNWYLNPNVALKWNWIHDMFDERLMGREHDVDTVITRFQIFW